MAEFDCVRLIACNAQDFRLKMETAAKLLAAANLFQRWNK